MALLLMDGFGGGDSTTGKWDPSSSSYTTTLDSYSRISGSYYGLTGTFAALSKSLSSPVNKMYVGMGAMAYYQAWSLSFYTDTGATTQITINRNTTSGFLEIRRGNVNGTLLATGTTSMLINTWYYIEVSCTISATIGEVHVRLNGSTIDEVSYTGNTKAGGTNTTIDRLLVNLDRCRVADVYVLDDSGSAPLNNFLGDVAVRTLTPNGNGNYSQLTNSASNSTNNYTYVDEHPYSGTDYVGSNVTGLKDSYAMADLPAGVSTVYALQVCSYMSKTDASLGQARSFVRSAANDYPGATRALSTTFVSYSDLYTTDPATGVSWTLSGVNNVEAGMEIL